MNLSFSVQCLLVICWQHDVPILLRGNPYTRAGQYLALRTSAGNDRFQDVLDLQEPGLNDDFAVAPSHPTISLNSLSGRTEFTPEFTVPRRPPGSGMQQNLPLIEKKAALRPPFLLLK
jgi:hypothetical protein